MSCLDIINKQSHRQRGAATERQSPQFVTPQSAQYKNAKHSEAGRSLPDASNENQHCLIFEQEASKKYETASELVGGSRKVDASDYEAGVRRNASVDRPRLQAAVPREQQHASMKKTYFNSNSVEHKIPTLKQSMQRKIKLKKFVDKTNITGNNQETSIFRSFA